MHVTCVHMGTCSRHSQWTTHTIPSRSSVGFSTCLISVSIEDTQTVDNLKKVIVKEKSTTFANIEADQLTLWKVSSTFSFGHSSMLITLLQGVYPDWHYLDDQE